MPSIGPVGGDYASLALAEAAQGDDPASDVTFTYIEAFEDTTDCTINFGNANAIDILVTVQSGVRFSDDVNWPSFADAEGNGAWRNAKLEITTPGVIVEWLEFTRTSAGRAIEGAGNSVIRYCIVRNCVTSGMFFTGSPTVHNCVTYHNGEAGIVSRSGGFVTAIHTLAFGNGQAGYGSSAGGTGVAKNCMAIGNIGVGFAAAWATGSDHNMSTDTSAPGSTVWHSVDAADILEDVGSGTEDFHWLSTISHGTYAGSDQSGTVGTLDIDGETRASTPDIGPDEIMSAPVTVKPWYVYAQQ